eukprot:1048408-Amphidinium_carterae.4
MSHNATSQTLDSHMMAGRRECATTNREQSKQASCNHEGIGSTHITISRSRHHLKLLSIGS